MEAETWSHLASNLRRPLEVVSATALYIRDSRKLQCWQPERSDKERFEVWRSEKKATFSEA